MLNLLLFVLSLLLGPQYFLLFDLVCFGGPDSGQVLLSGAVFKQFLSVDLGCGVSVLQELEALGLHVNLGSLLIDLLAEPLEVIVDLEQSLSVVDMLVFGLPRQVGNVYFGLRRGQVP